MAPGKRCAATILLDMALRIGVFVLVSLLLVLCIAASFLLFAGADVPRWPAVMDRGWFFVYAVQALISWLALYLVARRLEPRVTGEQLSGIVLLAWALQPLLLMTNLLGPLTGPVDAISYWVVLTGGVIQPIAAIAGAQMGLRRPT